MHGQNHTKYISCTNIPPIMIINRIYENQNLLSLLFVSFLVGLRTYQHPSTYPCRCRGLLLHLITHSDIHSVRLLWTRDRPVAETSTYKTHNISRNDIDAPRRDSNPQSRQASGRRPTPLPFHNDAHPILILLKQTARQ